MKIAIVDDMPSDAACLKECLSRYAKEKSLALQICEFTGAEAFLDYYYTGDYDLIFMDIRMPYMDGMTAAQRLRELDSAVLLVFVTSLSQYAVQSYAVEAADYIVKPFGYYDLAPKITRLLRRLRKQDEGELLIQTKEALVRLRYSEITYVESKGHRLLFHTADQVCEQRGALSALEKTLGPRGFARCNSCYLVNLRHVVKVKGYTATVGEDELQISQPRKKAFVRELIAYTEGKPL